MLRTLTSNCLRAGQIARSASAGGLGRITNVSAVQQVRGLRRWREKQLRELYQRSRRFDVAPQLIRPRSAWQDWNYTAELFAFAQRLNEGRLTEAALIKMFTHRSYVDQMERKQGELGIDETSIDVEHNEQLIAEGEALALPFIESYLRYFLRQAPEECIQALAQHLLSVEILSETAKWTGCVDLIQSAEFPPSEQTLANTTLALFGTMAKEVGTKSAQNFIIDFLLTHLNGVDLLEIWRIEELDLDLNQYLKARGMAEYEPRVLFEAAKGTLEASTVVGIYVDKKLIGQSPGESPAIAKSMAELDAFRQFFGLTPEKSRFVWGPKAHELELGMFRERKNVSLFEVGFKVEEGKANRQSA